MAAFDTGYTQRPVCATREEIEPKLTMAPLFFFRCGRAACISITEPTTFTSKALSQSARAVSAPLSRYVQATLTR